VEYFRGIANPIGIKVGPGLSGQDLVDLLKVLDPEKIPGKITLITRFGAQKVFFTFRYFHEFLLKSSIIFFHRYYNFLFVSIKFLIYKKL
jgi:hypothetical protein